MFHRERARSVTRAPCRYRILDVFALVARTVG
jgi:hypothetical protein